MHMLKIPLCGGKYNSVYTGLLMFSHQPYDLPGFVQDAYYSRISAVMSFYHKMS